MVLTEPIAEHPSLLPKLQSARCSQVAATVGLRYVSDETPGIRRVKRGKSFGFVDAQGKKITDEETLRRIRKLAIPPAYVDVWICPDPVGHIQATARDARGRKQYRYHARWREVRDAVKFHRMLSFAAALPTLREATDRDLEKRGLPREKVLAAVVQLLEQTHIRVGNEEYAKENKSYGLTTLRNQHAQVLGAKVRFEFKGKSNKRHRVELTDRRLARVVRACLDIPGQELFQYVDDDGARRSISSHDVNDYLRAISGQDFTAKDFRTWAATVGAAALFKACPKCTTKREEKQSLVKILAQVAEQLGNTPAVCKKSYVHPAVLDAFTGKWLAEVVPLRGLRKKSPYDLSESERFAVALLQLAIRREREKPTLQQSLQKSIAQAKKKAA